MLVPKYPVHSCPPCDFNIQANWFKFAPYLDWLPIPLIGDLVVSSWWQGCTGHSFISNVTAPFHRVLYWGSSHWYKSNYHSQPSNLLETRRANFMDSTLFYLLSGFRSRAQKQNFLSLPLKPRQSKNTSEIPQNIRTWVYLYFKPPHGHEDHKNVWTEDQDVDCH